MLTIFLKINLTKLILEGPSNELNKTENTQPAIFLASYAIFELLQKEFGFNLNKINFFAGHSLGEYTAITCSGALKFDDTLKLLKARGQAMQNSVPEGQGGMLAILGSNYAKSALEIEQPRVGLLTIGTEEGKGNNLINTTHLHLQSLSDVINYACLLYTSPSPRD